MNQTNKNIFAAILVLAVALLGVSQPASALTPLPEPDPKPGSYGLEATKPQAPPSTGATITTPSGGSFSDSPITVRGICPNGLLVQVHNNGVMVGSTMCQNGSFELEVSLFAGENELEARVYDDLGQEGPVSNRTTVTYNNTNLTAFGELVTLTSSYGRRSAPTGTQLTWPLQLSGGSGPYAFSLDWGDGSEVQLVSQAGPGVVTIDHAYERAGIYQVNVRVTDTNGVSAFMQLIAVSSGQVDGAALQEADESEDASPRTVVMWVPAAISFGLLLPTYWLGRRSQLVSLRNKMQKERDRYQQK